MVQTNILSPIGPVNPFRTSWRQPHGVSKPLAAFHLGAYSVVLHTLHRRIWYDKDRSAVSELQGCHDRLNHAVEAVAMFLRPNVLAYIREHLTALQAVSDELKDGLYQYRANPDGYEEKVDVEFGYPVGLGSNHWYDLIARLDDAFPDQPRLRACLQLGREVIALDPLCRDPQSISSHFGFRKTLDSRRPSLAVTNITHDDGDLLDPLLTALAAAPIVAQENVSVLARGLALREECSPRKCKTFLQRWLGLEDSVASQRPETFLATVAARLRLEAEEELSGLSEEGPGAVTSAAQPEPVSECPVFRRWGTKWELGWPGTKIVPLEDWVGLHHIHTLLCAKGQRVDALDFPGNSTSQAESAKRKMRNRGKRLNASKVQNPRELDAEGRKRLAQLEKNMVESKQGMEEAQAEGDDTMQDLCRKDFDRNYREAAELRDRQEPVKKQACSTVKKAIDRAIGKIAEEGRTIPALKKMAEHLKRTIRRATYGLIYNPEPGIDWEL